MSKVLIYGAAFNPISYGHLLTAEIVRDRKKFDKVLFTPSSSKRRDKSDELVSDEHRLNMIKLAIEDNEYFDICDIELKNPGWESKTEVTLRKYKEQNPEDDVCFLMGADNLLTISTWDNAYELVRDNKFVVVARDGYDMTKTIAEDELLSEFEDNFELIHKGIKMDISSTMIRKNSRIGKSLRYYLPDNCIKYIKDNNLYRT